MLNTQALPAIVRSNNGYGGGDDGDDSNAGSADVDAAGAAPGSPAAAAAAVVPLKTRNRLRRKKQNRWPQHEDTLVSYTNNFQLQYVFRRPRSVAHQIAMTNTHSNANTHRGGLDFYTLARGGN